MAARKPLFISSEGFSEEMAITDTMTLGGLTMGGNIAMGTYKITGLGDGTADQDAVTLSQLNAAVLTGGTVKEPLFVTDQLDDTDGINATEALYFANQPSVGNTVTIKNGAVTETYSFVANQGAESASTDVSIESSAVTAMQRLVLRANLNSSTWDYFFYATEHADINADGVIAVVEKATAAGASASRIYGTFTTQADLQVVEFASGTTPDIIPYYTQTAATASTSDPVNGRFGLRRQQSALTDGEIHLVLDTDYQWSWDADTTSWNLMSAGSVPDATSGSGGAIKGKVTFDSDKGLSVTTGIAEALIDAVTIDFNGSGQMKVTGLPLQFEVNGVATSTNVTAANLSALTGGGQISLHSHASAPATSSQRVENAIAVDESVSVADAVYWTATGSRVGVGDASVNAESRIIGVATTAQATVGQTATIVSQGIAAGVLTSATPGTPYFLQPTSGIGTSVPGANNRVVLVGYAATASDLWVSIHDYGKKAA